MRNRRGEGPGLSRENNGFCIINVKCRQHSCISSISSRTVRCVVVTYMLGGESGRCCARARESVHFTRVLCLCFWDMRYPSCRSVGFAARRSCEACPRPVVPRSSRTGVPSVILRRSVREVQNCWKASSSHGVTVDISRAVVLRGYTCAQNWEKDTHMYTLCTEGF